MSSQAAIRDDDDASEKRRHRRVELVLPARFMLPDKSEYEATLQNISAGGLMLKSDELPPMGTSVIVYVQEIGRLEGEVVRHFAGGFALTFTFATALRERIVEKLTCKINAAVSGVEQRSSMRRETDEKAHLMLADGSELECRVLDMSLGGLSLAVSLRPAIGELIHIGKMRGRVVRHHEQGIGVAFDTIQATWGSLSNSLR